MTNRTLIIREEHSKYYRQYHVIPMFGTSKAYKGKVFYKFNTTGYKTLEDVSKKLDDGSDGLRLVLFSQNGLAVGLKYARTMKAPIVTVKLAKAKAIKKLCEKKQIYCNRLPPKTMEYVYYHATERAEIPTALYLIAARHFAYARKPVNTKGAKT